MSEKQEQKNEDIREFGQVALNNNRENNRISLLTIIGEIEGHDCLPAMTKTVRTRASEAGGDGGQPGYGRNPAALKYSRRRR